MHGPLLYVQDFSDRCANSLSSTAMARKLLLQVRSLNKAYSLFIFCRERFTNLNGGLVASRMRITASGPRGQLEMTVEVMSILPGVYLVDIAKVTGDSVDFYNTYSKITELVQPLITADALRRVDSGGVILPIK